MFGLETSLFVLLIIAVLCVCAFEFINGFHDTANAVATVIYTNAMNPLPAVIWSGFCNFVGVFVGGIGVAMGIVNLLPVDVLVSQDVFSSIGMVLALLLTAIIWNLGTWYFGIPCSSSHTLIGSIVGVGIGYAFLPGSEGTAINMAKVKEVGASLLISPLLGFGLTYGLMKLFHLTIKQPDFFTAPKGKEPPKRWARLVLFLTCTGVSFSHGSNDGQKGVGLMMLVLIGILPAHFALNPDRSVNQIQGQLASVTPILTKLSTHQLDPESQKALKIALEQSTALKNTIKPDSNYSDQAKFEIRKEIMLITRNLKTLEARSTFEVLPELEQKQIKAYTKDLSRFIEFAPFWVILLIAVSLGVGTTIGWKRIVITVGGKIGKTHLTYAQGSASELIAASTIGLSSGLGLPVSTTHILSSGIAGSMVSENGLDNLQRKTVYNIVLAWVLTLPVCIVVSAGLFLLFRWIL